jgi:hypothetical protein
MHLEHTPHAARAPKPNGLDTAVVLAAHTAGATPPLTPSRWPRLLPLISASCRRLGLPQVGAAKAVAPTQGDVSRRLRLVRRRRIATASAGRKPAIHVRAGRLLWDWTCAAAALLCLVAMFYGFLLLAV